MQGISISPDKPLPYTTIEPWVKKIGVITGFPQVTRPYSLRYGAGTALDSSGTLLQYIGLQVTQTNASQDLLVIHCAISSCIMPTPVRSCAIISAEGLIKTSLPSFAALTCVSSVRGIL